MSSNYGLVEDLERHEKKKRKKKVKYLFGGGTFAGIEFEELVEEAAGGFGDSGWVDDLTARDVAEELVF